MDELTAERFGPGVPRRERLAKPNPIPRGDSAFVIRARRVILCGTSNLDVMDVAERTSSDGRQSVTPVRHRSRGAG